MRAIKKLNSLEIAYEFGYKIGLSHPFDSELIKNPQINNVPMTEREENRFWSGYDCGRVAAMRMLK